MTSPEERTVTAPIPAPRRTPPRRGRFTMAGSVGTGSSSPLRSPISGMISTDQDLALGGITGTPRGVSVGAGATGATPRRRTSEHEQRTDEGDRDYSSGDDDGDRKQHPIALSDTSGNTTCCLVAGCAKLLEQFSVWMISDSEQVQSPKISRFKGNPGSSWL